MMSRSLTLVPSLECGWWRCVAYQEAVQPERLFTGPGTSLQAIPLEVEPAFQYVDFDGSKRSDGFRMSDGFYKNRHLWKWAKAQTWPDDPLEYLARLGIGVTASGAIPTVEQRIVGLSNPNASALKDMLGWHVLTLLLTPSVGRLTPDLCRHIKDDAHETFTPWRWMHHPPPETSLVSVAEEDRTFLFTQDRALVTDFMATRLLSICKEGSAAIRSVLAYAADSLIAKAEPDGVEIHEVEVSPDAGGASVLIAGKWGRSRDVLFEPNDTIQTPFRVQVKVPDSASAG